MQNKLIGPCRHQAAFLDAYPWHLTEAHVGLQGHGEQTQTWVQRLGQLIYAVEHQRTLLYEMVRQAARDAELPVGLEVLEPPLSGEEPSYAIGCDPLPVQHHADGLAGWAVEGGGHAFSEPQDMAEPGGRAGEEDQSLLHFSPLSGDSQQLELAGSHAGDSIQPLQDRQQQSQQLQVSPSLPIP